jgi:hypothetical protein
MMTRQRSPKKTSSSTPDRRHSSRKIVTQTKSRITSMCKFISKFPKKTNISSSSANTHDSNDEDNNNITEEESSSGKRSSLRSNPKTTSNEKPIINIEDDSIEFPDKGLSTPIDLHVTPTSTSSISLSLNDSDNTDKKDKNQNTSEIIDETHLVQNIEAVRNTNKDGISFRIKLINENEVKWIPSKIANQKYPQAVIAFWENHVEFA